MMCSIINWQEGSEGYAQFGPASVLLPEHAEDFEAAAPYGYARSVGDVDMDRMVLIDRVPRGDAEPKETPVTVWSLDEQRAKRGADAHVKEQARLAADSEASSRPGAYGAKALARVGKREELKSLLAEIPPEEIGALVGARK